MELFGSVFFSFVVASVEEGVKYTILKHIFKQTDFNEPYDGIVYAVMISLGFADWLFMQFKVVLMWLR